MSSLTYVPAESDLLFYAVGSTYNCAYCKERNLISDRKQIVVALVDSRTQEIHDDLLIGHECSRCKETTTIAIKLTHQFRVHPAIELDED